MTNNMPIDVVLPWVDGSDISWIKQRNQHSGKNKLSAEEVEAIARQYRNWDNLQYILRGIEVFMPWVRTVHLVTNGQKPTWLNEKATKLNWVKHEDFIPHEYLPLFSSHVIDLNLHRISGIAERFIYLNDDTFITKPTKPTVFFARNGLPLDQAVFMRISSPSYSDPFGHYMLNNIGVINQNFDRNQVVKKYFSKFFSIKNGLLSPIFNATYLPTNHFPGFIVPHMPQSYLKSTFEQAWEREGSILEATCHNKFRNITDVNQYVMRGWQLASGNFKPANILKSSRYFSVFPRQLHEASRSITSNKYRMVCINDSEVGDFEETKKTINNSLQNILPSKSEYEL